MKDKPTDFLFQWPPCIFLFFFAHGCFLLIYLEQSNVDYDGQIHEVKGSWEESMFLVYNIIVRYVFIIKM